MSFDLLSLMFCSSSQSDAIAALISGGLDSAIMVNYLLQSTRADIYPVHLATDLRWAEREQQAASDYIDAIATPRLKQLVQLRLPLAHPPPWMHTIPGSGPFSSFGRYRSSSSVRPP